jgi:hypothetical protein
VKALSATSTARETGELSRSVSVATRLRALAQQHGEGKLSRDAYRKLRAPLIDALDGSDISDPQSSTTIPHFEPRIRGAPASSAGLEPPPGGKLRKMLARITASWRR